jgi:hypothetical protein
MQQPRQAQAAPVQAATGGIPLTGNADADADIAAFYKAKEELLKRTRSAGGGGGGAATGGLAAVMAEAARMSAATMGGPGQSGAGRQ